MKILKILFLAKLSAGIACPNGWTQEGKIMFQGEPFLI